MNTITLINDFHTNKDYQQLILHKKYNYDLLCIFPTVIELIINEYMIDIIQVIVKNITWYPFCNLTKFWFAIEKQYINHQEIRLHFDIRINVNTNTMYDIDIFEINNNIGNITKLVHNYDDMWTLLALFNQYMSKHYNKIDYLGKYHLLHDRKLVTIHNHKLFKNIIIILKCIINHIRKKLNTSLLY